MSTKDLAKRIIDRLSNKGFVDGDRSLKKRMWEAVSEGLLGYFEDEGLPGTNNTDESVKVSSNDASSGYLKGKIVAGSNIVIIEQNDGGNETIEIEAQNDTVNPSRTDEFDPSGPQDNVFELQEAPIIGTEKVSWNGVKMSPGEDRDYSLSGTTLTAHFPVMLGDGVDVYYEYAD